MPKRTLTGLEKLKLVLDSLEANTAISSLCEKRGISRSTFYRSKKIFEVVLTVLLTGETPVKKRASRDHKHTHRCQLK
jgi:transposase-like protein